MITDTSQKRQRDENTPAFIYFVSYLLRNTISAKNIGEVCTDVSIGRWLTQNRFNCIFALKTSQLFTTDIRSISKLQVEVIVGYNPFKNLDLTEIEVVLECLDGASVGCVLAIPTAEHHDVPLKSVYSVNQWKEILGQLGVVVVIHHCRQWSLFLVLK